MTNYRLISKDLMASSEYMSEPYLNLNKFQADHNFPHLANTLHCKLTIVHTKIIH